MGPRDAPTLGLARYLPDSEPAGIKDLHPDSRLRLSHGVELETKLSKSRARSTRSQSPVRQQRSARSGRQETDDKKQTAKNRLQETDCKKQNQETDGKKQTARSGLQETDCKKRIAKKPAVRSGSNDGSKPGYQRQRPPASRKARLMRRSDQGCGISVNTSREFQ